MFFQKIIELLYKLIKRVYNKEEKLNIEEIEELEKNEESEENEEDQNDELTSEIFPIAVFEINILNNGNLGISCGWTEKTDSIARTYGHMLGMICNGQLKLEILQTLNTYIKKNDDTSIFIAKVLTAWEEIIQEEPMKPSEVFNNASTNKQNSP